jgi:hypothetical protein
MPSVSDLSSSFMKYIFIKHYSEIAKSEEKTNVAQES